MRTDEALRYAQSRDLDLVEVAAAARPPVCRVLDYSKYKYEQAQKKKTAKKHQTQVVTREIKFRPKIADHDYATKKGHVIRFLKGKDKVKVTIMFRGREVTHPERGRMVLERLVEDLGDLAQIDQRPNLEGRNMTMMLSPSKAVINGTWVPLGDRDDGEADDGDGVTVDGTAEAPAADGAAPEAPEAVVEEPAADEVEESEDAPADEVEQADDAPADEVEETTAEDAEVEQVEEPASAPADAS
ncbi:Translation initiation factor 3 [Patulibacter medicamentivorans]|uniref:Translation initiation factor IF-3 n=2 Tax=Patulibacter medicamentivorans TaxID=1097667 RepID=H0E7M9_9ACTN|nr:Translation initiation factor 3 [Patulibacter medicamentivorans]